MTSNFRDAVRRAQEVDLVCPKCGACNRPGVLYIKIGQDGQAECSVCSKTFNPEEK